MKITYVMSALRDTQILGNIRHILSSNIETIGTLRKSTLIKNSFFRCKIKYILTLENFLRFTQKIQGQPNRKI